MTVIERAARAGIRLRLDGEYVVASGPSAPDPNLVDEIRSHRAEVVAILQGRACSHCGAEALPGGHLVATYWTLWRQALCAPCARLMAKEFDQHDSWPSVPPELIGGSTLEGRP